MPIAGHCQPPWKRATGLSCMRAFLIALFSRRMRSITACGGVTIFGGRPSMRWILYWRRAISRSRRQRRPSGQAAVRRATGLASRVKPKIKYPRSSTRKRRPSKRRLAPAAPDPRTRPPCSNRPLSAGSPAAAGTASIIHSSKRATRRAIRTSFPDCPWRSWGGAWRAPARARRRSPPPACHRGNAR